MGAGGAAVAGSVGQALANYLNLQQQRALLAQRQGAVGTDTPAITPGTGQALEMAARMLGLPVPEGGFEDFPASWGPALISAGAAMARAKQGAGVGTTGDPATSVSGETLDLLSRWIAGEQVDLSQLQGISPGLATEALRRRGATPDQVGQPSAPAGVSMSDLQRLVDFVRQGGTVPLTGETHVPTSVATEVIQQTAEPPVTLFTTPAMRRAGAPERVTLGQYETLQGLFPEPELEDTIMITVGEDDPQQFGELVDFYPELAGKQITMREAQARLNFARDLLRLRGEAVDAQRKAWEFQRDKAQWEGKRLTEDQARRFFRQWVRDETIEPVFIPGPDGKVDFDTFVQQNESLLRLAQGAQELTLGALNVEEKQVDLVLKRLEAAYRPGILRAQARQAAAQAQIDEARADQIYDELALDRAYTQAEIDRIKQQVSQGKALFDITLEIERENLAKARAERKITEAEAQYADQLAQSKAAYLQYEALRAQQEIQELPLNAIWVQLGLPGAPPEGFKMYRWQFDEMLDFLNSNRGRVVKASVLLQAAGIDTKGMPKELLDAPVQIDSAGELIDVITTMAGVRAEQIANSVDLIAKIVNIVAPPLATDLTAQLIAANNPQLAAELLKPKISVLQKVSPGLYEWAVNELNRATQNILSSPAGAVNPTVQQAAQEAIRRSGGDAARAYSTAINPQVRNQALNDPNSPFYQNPTLYDAFVAYLSSLAAGGQ